MLQFCVCAFIGVVHLAGGDYRGLQNTTKTFLQFRTDYKWKEVSKMNQARRRAASTVFERRIASVYDCYYNTLNTVESYHALTNKWSPMPNIVRAKESHNLV